jgi:hypothetical protein
LRVKGYAKKETAKTESQPTGAKAEIIGVLIIARLILSDRHLKAFEPDRSIEIIAVEKGTMTVYGFDKQLQPQVILFAHLEPLPHLKEICKAIKELIKPQIKTQLLLLGNIPLRRKSST